MKKFLAILMALAMVLSMGTFASASSELAGEYDVTIWAPDAAVALTTSQVEAFNANNEFGITINATVEPVSEADAATNMITDVSAGGDLYFFAQDQLSRLIQAGALTKLGQGAAAFVKDNNSAGSTLAAQSGSDYYAYPLTADNGYFMYYDKSVIPEEDIDSLEKLVADCEAAGKNFSFELENAWYNAGFFFGVGCHSDWITDNDGNFISIDDDFNSEKGLIAAKGLYSIVSSPCYVNSSNTDFASGSAVVVTGTWNYATILEQLGDNFGVADLPSFTVDGQEYHIGSYSGCKLLGVKPQEDAVKGAALNQLAQYLTGQECQTQRAADPDQGGLGWGPSNKAALEDPACSNPALVALSEQNAYAIPQPNIHGSWWDIAKVITTDIKDKGAGASDGDVWTSNEAFEMEAGTEFKCRQGKAWDVAYPADNFVVDAAGTYYVQLDAASGEVSLVPAE